MIRIFSQRPRRQAASASLREMVLKHGRVDNPPYDTLFSTEEMELKTI